MMKHGMLVASALACNTVLSQGTWTQLATPGELYDGLDIVFTSEDTGFVCGSLAAFTWSGTGAGQLYRTVDGGASWELKVNDTADVLRSLSFPDAQHGFCLANDHRIYRTEDGGDTWTSSEVPYFALFNVDLCFSTPERGFLRTENPPQYPQYRTEDGGDNWTSTMAVPRFNDMVFVDSARGYLCGQAPYPVMRTVDGGLHWSPENTPSGITNMLGIDFTDVLHGCCVGTVGRVMYTASGDQQMWVTVDTDIGEDKILWDVSMAPTGLAILVGGLRGDTSSVLEMSTDFGATWAPQDVSPVAYRATCMLDDGTGFVVGQNEVWKFAPDDDSGVELLTSGSSHQVYPSPVRDGFHVVRPTGAGGACPWRLLDAQGRMVRSELLRATGTWMHRGDLTTGIYLSEVSGDVGVSRVRIVLE